MNLESALQLFEVVTENDRAAKVLVRIFVFWRMKLGCLTSFSCSLSSAS